MATVVLTTTTPTTVLPCRSMPTQAWDSGAVTTGCVTVPLVLALGIGAAFSLCFPLAFVAVFGVQTDWVLVLCA